MERKRKEFSNLTLVIFSTVIFLVLVEILTRTTIYFFKSPMLDRLLSYNVVDSNKMFQSAHILDNPYVVNDKGLLWKNKKNISSPAFFTNSHGLISKNEFSFKKPAKSLRILFLGDSSTAGWELGVMNFNYVERLGKMLQEENNNNSEKIQLINSAVVGYTSLQGLLYFKQEGLTYSPDVIVVYFGNNDASMNGYLSDKELIGNPLFKKVNGFLEYLKFYQVLKSMFLPLKQKVTENLKQKDRKEAKLRVSPDEYYENIEEIIKIAQKNNIKVYLIIPSVSLKWPPLLLFKNASIMERSNSGGYLFSDEIRELLNREIMYCVVPENLPKAAKSSLRYLVYSSAYSEEPSEANIAKYSDKIERKVFPLSLYQNNLGVLFWRQGKMTEALRYFKDALKSDPRDPVIHYNIGVVYENLGSEDLSRKELEEAKELDFLTLRIKTAYKNALRILSKKYNLRLIDIDALFNKNGNELFITDHCHPNEKGHIAIAREVYLAMKEDEIF